VAATTFFIMPKRPRYVVALAIAGLLTVRLVGPQLAERYSTAFVEAEERDESAESRVELWKDCLDVALRQPIFGVGPRNWPLIASSYGWPPGKEAHSVWMQTLAETGFPGVGLLALFFLLAIIGLWPLARAPVRADNRLEVGVAIGVMLSIVGFAVSGQFVSVSGLEIPYYTTLAGAVLLRAVAEREANALAQVSSAPKTEAAPRAARPTPPMPRPSPAALTSSIQRKPLRWT
jgi:O-antigen ligase